MSLIDTLPLPWTTALAMAISPSIHNKPIAAKSGHHSVSGIVCGERLSRIKNAK
jgi:hypothetical protein